MAKNKNMILIRIEKDLAKWDTALMFAELQRYMLMHLEVKDR